MQWCKRKAIDYQVVPLSNGTEEYLINIDLAIEYRDPERNTTAPSTAFINGWRTDEKTNIESTQPDGTKKIKL